MINLMPDDAKKELKAARTNTLLIRYMGVIVIAFSFIGLVMSGAYFLLNQTRDSALQLIEANDTKAEVYSETRTQVDALNNSLTSARTILDQEVQYSKVLINIGKLMPSGTVIDKLTLSSTSFGATPMSLQIYAKTTNDAVLLGERFQASSLFSNVNVQSVSDTTGGIDGYPVSATMTLSINREAGR